MPARSSAASRRWKPGWPIRAAGGRRRRRVRRVIEIDLADVKEPIVCCPNDPDDARRCRDVAGAKIDEVFIGSCMTNIGHFRAASKLLEGKRDIPVKLWMAPAHQDGRGRADQGRPLRRVRRGRCAHGNAGLQLCMGNQAQVKEGATVLSTSTRNFPNRLGKNTNVYLGRPNWRRSAPSWAHPDQGRVPRRHGRAQRQRRQDLPYMNFDQISSRASRSTESRPSPSHASSGAPCR
jgi:aconitate hydratase 2/2-methylisocitrate dehydratase